MNHRLRAWRREWMPVLVPEPSFWARHWGLDSRPLTGGHLRHGCFSMLLTRSSTLVLAHHRMCQLLSHPWHRPLKSWTKEPCTWEANISYVCPVAVPPPPQAALRRAEKPSLGGRRRGQLPPAPPVQHPWLSCFLSSSSSTLFFIFCLFKRSP